MSATAGAKYRNSSSFAQGLQRLVLEDCEPLAPGMRHFMENGFGCDLGDVVVHHSPLSDALNRRLGSRGFAHGDHLCFAEGAYDPDLTEGRWLLAHALARLLQQRLGRALRPPRPRTALHDLLIEMEADRAADIVVQGGQYSCSIADDKGEAIGAATGVRPARSPVEKRGRQPLRSQLAG